jgi:hypothetical protein
MLDGHHRLARTDQDDTWSEIQSTAGSSPAVRPRDEYGR